MIVSFKHKGLERFFKKGSLGGIEAKHKKKLRMQLAALDTAHEIEDVDIPGYRLRPLKGNRKGIWAIDVSGNWRLTFELSGRYLAAQLDVSASTLNRILKRQSGVSPEMALRLSKALGRTPESWLAMQDAFNLWKVRKQVKLGRVHPVKLEQHVYVAAAG